MEKIPLTIVLIIVLSIGGLLGPRSDAAQALELHEKTIAQSENLRVQYLTYGVSRSAMVHFPSCYVYVNGDHRSEAQLQPTATGCTEDI